VSAIAFKIMSDAYVGQLTFLRVYSGVLRTGDTVLNATRNKRDRIGRLVRMHANKREDIKELHAGSIGAAVGLRTAATGDTLCDPAAPIQLETMDFPAPVIGVAIEPVTTEDSEPEPDVRVVRGERRAFAERHPGPRDLGLLVEVSDATLERDRKLKKQLYGQSLVPVYWIVDLRHRRIEVSTEPSGPVAVPGYGSRREFVAGEEVPVVLDGVEVGRSAVSDILS